MFSVIDTGTGIEPEVMPRLFTKFPMKSTMGTGLGLSSSKKIIEARGSRRWGENNKEDVAATLSFTLPALQG
ncbi:MAG TPA: ATP-binding protein [Nitrososphaera sp.]